MKLYLRCVYANKLTLAGYLSLIALVLFCIVLSLEVITVPIEYAEKIISLLLYSTCLGLTISAGCFETLHSCKKTLKHLKKVGRIDPRYADIYLTYCDYAGYKLAVKIWMEEGMPRV